MSAPLRIDVARHGEAAVVRLLGVLDIASEPTLSQAIEGLHRDGVRAMRIDLSEVDVIDSLGIGALLRVWRTWEARGHRIEFVAPARPSVRRVFDLMGADDDLPFAGPNPRGPGPIASAPDHGWTATSSPD